MAVRTLTVLLDTDMEEEGIDHMIKTISSIKRVTKVLPGEEVQSRDYMARLAGQRELAEILYKLWSISGQFGGDPDKYRRLCELLEVERGRYA